MNRRHSLVDELFEEFRSCAPKVLQTPIRNLACTLRLTPSPDITWSRVFNHEVTLAAPLVISEAMPGIDPTLTRDASSAHLLAIVEAFGTDRVEDGQVEPSAELMAVLGEVRAARDLALARVVRGCAAGPTYAEAQAVTHDAIGQERAVLSAGTPISLLEYQRISGRKQAVGMPACLALAQAAGWNPRELVSLNRMLLSIWLGLQAHDDVADWWDDSRRGGAWAVNLALGEVASHAGLEREEALRALVHRSGVLARMLRLSHRQYRAARRRATALGAVRLARWCYEREREIDGLAAHEADHPGYVVRARALAAMRQEVLA